MSIELSALTLIDYGALILLLISGGLATLRGMTRELFGLAGWPISFIAAIKFGSFGAKALFISVDTFCRRDFANLYSF